MNEHFNIKSEHLMLPGIHSIAQKTFGNIEAFLAFEEKKVSRLRRKKLLLEFK